KQKQRESDTAITEARRRQRESDIAITEFLQRQAIEEERQREAIAAIEEERTRAILPLSNAFWRNQASNIQLIPISRHEMSFRVNNSVPSNERRSADEAWNELDVATGMLGQTMFSGFMRHMPNAHTNIIEPPTQEEERFTQQYQQATQIMQQNNPSNGGLMS